MDTNKNVSSFSRSYWDIVAIDLSDIGSVGRRDLGVIERNVRMILNGMARMTARLNIGTMRDLGISLRKVFDDFKLDPDILRKMNEGEKIALAKKIENYIRETKNKQWRDRYHNKKKEAVEVIKEEHAKVNDNAGISKIRNEMIHFLSNPNIDATWTKWEQARLSIRQIFIDF